MKRLLLTLIVILGSRDIRAEETVTSPITPTMPASIPSTWLTYHLAHPGPDMAIPADPNCAIHYKGRYHLFYIHQNQGHSFAHVSSTDMVHWKWHVTTLTPPKTGHGMFSGTAFLTREGKPTIIYHGQGTDRNQIAFALDVNNQYHFSYADGTPYFPFGTTCYAWIHQGDEREEQTLETLKTASFNKMRMCVFPKSYSYKKNEPQYYPFEGTAPKDWDFARYNPEFFRHLERRVGDLLELGIEADIILFHPYDRWRFSEMDAENDYRYLKYVTARLSAYRNVWWSMANEYDFLLSRKPMSQWDRFFEIVRDDDPYGHLRSIHNGDVENNYDHTKPWITHVCIQNWDVKRAKPWRREFKKPVINDECEYEGNVPLPWGNISARELVHRFWTMATNGCYAGHGETYVNPEQILWWSKGGTLVGESWKRILFLKKIMEEGPGDGLTPLENSWVWSRVTGGMNGDYRLIYLGEHQPVSWFYGRPTNKRFKVDVIDTWNMTITRHDKIYVSDDEIPLPGKPHLAIRIRGAK